MGLMVLLRASFFALKKTSAIKAIQNGQPILRMMWGSKRLRGENMMTV